MLHEGKTGADGKARAGFELPRDAEGATLLIEASGRKGSAETAFRIGGAA